MNEDVELAHVEHAIKLLNDENYRAIVALNIPTTVYPGFQNNPEGLFPEINARVRHEGLHPIWREIPPRPGSGAHFNQVLIISLSENLSDDEDQEIQITGRIETKN